MTQEIEVPVQQWETFLKELEDGFERPVEARFWKGRVDVEALFVSLLPAEDDLVWRGRVSIGHELRLALAAEKGGEPTTISRFAKMTELLPRKDRRAVWQRLQQAMEWRLPKLGLPIWLQHVWGLVLLASGVGMFIWPLIGMAVFFGGLFLMYRAEKLASSFQYPTFDTLVTATVKLNWPSLELGAADDAHLRLLFAEVMARHVAPGLDPHAAFPIVIPSEAKRSRET